MIKVQGSTHPGLFLVEAEGKEPLEVLKSLTGYEAAHEIAAWFNTPVDVPVDVALAATIKSRTLPPKADK
jgi:hypothetical protein